jgi:transposase
MSKHHIEQFKQEAVAYVPSNKDKPVKAIAQSLGVGYSTLDNWVRKASCTVRRELSRNRQRILQLEREVAHHFLQKTPMPWGCA